MSIAAWRAGAGFILLFVAAIFFAGGLVLEGAVTVALTAIWVADHAVVPEWLGARFLHHRAYVELAKIVASGVLALATTAALVVAMLLHWNRNDDGPILFAALCGVLFLLEREIERRYDLFQNYMDGGDAEVAVSVELHALPSDWRHEDNWLRPDRKSNVDHIVVRPDGEWFAIETKSGRFFHGAAAQAVSGALAVKEARGARWVTPVLCVPKPQPPRQVTVGRASVWVVARDDLAAWLPGAASTRRY